MNRPSKREWAFGVALAVAARGECVRRQVGAIILDLDGRIAAAGYNGNFAGGPSCLEGECPRGSSDVEPGSSYDTGPGACHSVHAELNAYLDLSDKSRARGGVMFVTAKPCDGCLKILKNTPLARIYYMADAQDLRYDMILLPHGRLKP